MFSSHWNLSVEKNKTWSLIKPLTWSEVACCWQPWTLLQWGSTSATTGFCLQFVGPCKKTPDSTAFIIVFWCRRCHARCLQEPCIMWPAQTTPSGSDMAAHHNQHDSTFSWFTSALRSPHGACSSSITSHRIPCQSREIPGCISQSQWAETSGRKCKTFSGVLNYEL